MEKIQKYEEEIMKLQYENKQLKDYISLLEKELSELREQHNLNVNTKMVQRGYIVVRTDLEGSC